MKLDSKVASKASDSKGEVLVNARTTHQAPKQRFWASYILSAAAVAVALLMAKTALEATVVGEYFEARAQEVLSKAFQNFRPDGLDITLLDITHLNLGREDPTTGKLLPTPRRDLIALLKALGPLRPKAVGIDIDFSPADGWWVDDQDPAFLEQCLEFNRSSAPLVLGVFRGMQGNRGAWLGAPEYAPLAGNMWLPGDLERAPVWTKAAGTEDRLPSFGAALAAAMKPESRWRQNTSAFQRFRQRYAQEEDGLLINEVLADYSIAQQVAREVIKITSVDQLFRYRSAISGKVVILGEVDHARDRFKVPGQPREIAGVVAHAAVAYSLASEPIYEFSHGARIALDIAVSLAFMAAVPLLTRQHRRPPSNVAVQTSERRVRAWLVVLVLAAGSVFVLLARTLWLDFFLVAVCLIIHPLASTALHNFLHR